MVLCNVLEGWCKMNYKEPEHIWYELMWNNYKILNNSQPIMYQNWFTNGIQQLSDIVKDNRFMSFHEIKDKYNLHNCEFLNYHKLIACIPKSWKYKIQQHPNQGNPYPSLIEKSQKEQVNVQDVV